MLEATLILATMAQRIELSLVDQEPMPILPAITLRPEKAMGMRVKLRK